MIEPLLLPSNTLDGPRRVTVTVRPRRVAYLVAPEAPALALAAIEACCLQWGGRFSFLIPCAAGRRPEPLWARILDMHDPDVLVDMVGAEQEFLDAQRGQRNRAVHRWQRPTETMEFVNPLVYGALSRWRRTRPSNFRHYTVHLHPLTGHPLALPLAYRLGHLDLRPMEERSVRSEAYQAAKHSDFLEVDEVDPGTVTEDQLIQLATEVDFLHPLHDHLKQRSGLIQAARIPNLTREGIPCFEPPYRHWPPGSTPDPEDEQHDEAYYHRCVGSRGHPPRRVSIFSRHRAPASALGSADHTPDVRLA